MRNQSDADISSHRYLLVLALLVLSMVIFLELGHPYFFFQDDNRGLYLPYLVHNLRSLSGGEIPFFNFHQSLGIPTALHYATFYPLNYLGLGLSKLISGDWFMTMDILAALHLEIAAFGFYFLMRHFRVMPVSALFGAIAWPFCSFVVTVGNSWGQVIGYAAWLPWILLFSLRHLGNVRPGEFATLVILRVMALLVGNPQYFVYVVTFDLLVLLAFYLTASSEKPDGQPVATGNSGRVSGVKLCIAWCGSHLLVLALALPLVVQTLRQSAQSVTRKGDLSWEAYASVDYQVSHWLNGIITPFRDMPVTTWIEPQFISHIGYLTTCFLVFALLCLKRSGRGKEIALLLAFALFSFLWAADIGVTKLFYYLPVYNKFRFPFKLLFFTSFFLIMAATIGFDLFLGRTGRGTGQRGALIVLLLALHVANFVGLYALPPQRMFAVMEDRVPFHEPLKNVLADGRIVTGWLDPVVVNGKGYLGKVVPTIGYNYATLWGLSYFGGYDPLLPEKNYHVTLRRVNRGDFNVEKGKALDIERDVPLEYFRKWGVRWYLFEKSIPLVNTGGLVVTGYGDSARNVLYDPEALPLVYWQDNPHQGGIRYRFSTNTVQIETNSPSGGLLVVGVLHHPFFSAVMNGRTLAVSETDEGQMALQVPSGKQTLTLRYRDPEFFAYAGVSLFTAVVFCLGTGYLLSRPDRRRSGAD